MAFLIALGGIVGAQPGPVKIVVITDMTGVYSAVSGEGAVVATKMSVADFGGKVLGRPIEIVVIDHRNNASESALKAREALEGGGDMLLDMTNSAVALADIAVAKEKHKLAIVTGAPSSALTGTACSKYTYHYAFDAYSLASSTGHSIARRADAKIWYGIVPNYSFGTQMLADFTNAIEPEGGKFVKSDVYPFPQTSDFSTYLLNAKNSGAQVLGVFNVGLDAVNTMKQVKQLGIDKQMRVAVGLLYLTDVDALPDVYSGSRITTSWYWDEDKTARAWADRFTKARGQGLRPSDVQAADYSATMQWLNAVKAVGSTDADKIVGYLDGRPFNDFYARGAEWRARDHRVTHDMYVVDVIPKEGITEPHAWFKVVDVIPPAVAFRPASQSVCKRDW